jgi:hypothetical protein
MFAGVGAMILMIPINGLIARLMKTLQKEQMKNKVRCFASYIPPSFSRYPNFLYLDDVLRCKAGD